MLQFFGTFFGMFFLAWLINSAGRSRAARDQAMAERIAEAISTTLGR